MEKLEKIVGKNSTTGEKIILGFTFASYGLFCISMFMNYFGEDVCCLGGASIFGGFLGLGTYSYLYYKNRF